MTSSSRPSTRRLILELVQLDGWDEAALKVDMLALRQQVKVLLDPSV